MGQPKALLPFDKLPLISHIVETLSQMFDDIVVVTAPEQELPVLPATLVRDEVSGQGPVAGMCYGLKAMKGDVGFVTSCDTAFLQLSLIKYLVSQLRGDDGVYDCVVPSWAGRLQPLHALYTSRVVSHLERQLDLRRLRPVYLYDTVPTRIVSPEEIRSVDPEGISFTNLNTPEDYQAALVRWADLHSDISCTVELFGVARLRAHRSTILLSVSPPANLVAVLRVLAIECPELVGTALTVGETGTTRLMDGYACNINGKEFVKEGDRRIRSGDHLLILSSDAGG